MVEQYEIEAIAQARLYMRDKHILVGSMVSIPEIDEPVTYLGLLWNENGLDAVVRAIGDILLTVHYSRIRLAKEL